MSRNRSNFVRVMGTASAVVLSSTLAMPVVAIAADTDGAELVALEDASPADQAKADEVIAMIDELGTDVSYADEVAYQGLLDAETAYGNLTAKQKALVTNYSQLRDVRKACDAEIAKVAEVETYIKNKINDQGKWTIAALSLQTDAPLVKEARKMYDELGDLQVRVSADAETKLKLAEDDIDRAQDKVDEALKAAAKKMDNATSVVSIDDVTAKKDQDKAINPPAIDYAGSTIAVTGVKQYGTAAGEWSAVAASTDATVKDAALHVQDVVDAVRTAEKTLADKQAIAADAARNYSKASDADKPAKKVLLDKANADVTAAEKDLATKQGAMDTLSEGQKTLAESYDKWKDLGDACDVVPSKVVTNLISAIDPVAKTTTAKSIAQLTLDDEPFVNAAAEAFNNLNTYQKTEVAGTTMQKTAADKYLQKAIQRIEDLKAGDEDHQKAMAVEQQIAALPALEDLTYGDKGAVEAARAAYDALTDAQKALVNEELVKALEDAEKRIEELKPVLTAQVYRLYNNYSGEHFYTADESEKDALVAIGWVNETDEKNSWWSADETGDPVYRLYNPNADGGDHHYTMSTEEVDALVALGWQKDNDGKPVFFSADDEFGVPVYRAYNGNAEAHNHNYTASLDEQTALVKAGWTGEGIAFYGMPNLKDAE